MPGKYTPNIPAFDVMNEQGDDITLLHPIELQIHLAQPFFQEVDIEVGTLEARIGQ